MEQILLSVTGIGDARLGGGDSFCDRLNCKYTTFLLVTCALLLTTRFYFGDPISCFCPAHFTKSHVDYTNRLCWVINTYQLPWDSEVPKPGEDKRLIGYYQWVGLILCCQAVLFYLPRTIWYAFNKKSGISVNTFTDAAIECQRKQTIEERDRTVQYMTNHMARFLKENHRRHLLYSRMGHVITFLHGCSLSALFLLIKLLYMANIVGQLYLLDAFLVTPFKFYGVEVLARILSRRQFWGFTERFPRITYCDMHIRVLGAVQRYTIQCALPVNLFSEWVYVFIWFWFVITGAATVTSFVLWAYRCISFEKQFHYVRTRLIATGKISHSPRHRDTVKEFVCRYLCRDGVLIIRLVSHNATDLIAAEFVSGLYEKFKLDKEAIKRLTSREQEAAADL